MPLGLYISVPFCRTKCSYCNFASDVFSRAVFQRYVERVCADIKHAAETAEDRWAARSSGSSTPSTWAAALLLYWILAQLERLFVTISQNFEVQPDAEITVECAPGTLTAAMLELFGAAA